MRIWNKAANTPWAITEDHLRVILDIAARQNQSPEAVAAELGRKLENTYEVEYRRSVAILSVEGPLFRYANLFTRISGATSYERLAQDFSAAVADDRVRAIVLNINSPGGEADGNAEFAEMIYAARGVKPIVAYVGGLGASAAYWIASAADEVVAHETALLGSIGVRTALIDDSERRAREGRREYVIVSSQSPHKDVDATKEGDRARVQQIVDDLAAVFVAKVARNRGVSEETVLERFGQGDVLVGQKAVAAGLADRLGSFEGIVAQLAGDEPSTATFPLAADPATFNAEGVQPMTAQEKYWLTNDPALAEIPATAQNLNRYFPEACQEIQADYLERSGLTAELTAAKRKAEEAREQGAESVRELARSILTCEEARGRYQTAQALAVTPGITLENARQILSAQPVDPLEMADASARNPGSRTPAEAQGFVSAARARGFIH
jgi:signal peptide peptidase SppA